MKLLKFLISIMTMTVLLSPLSAIAALDPEIRESKKCSNLFTYFEKKYNLPKDTLHSISLQETRKRHEHFEFNLVWPWTVNVNGKGYHFKTKDQAIKFTQGQIDAGMQSIDVGCMQINLKFHPDAFSSLEQAFSPRRNVAYGARFLKDKYAQYGNWDKAIGSYHSATHSRSTKYSNKVKKLAKDMPSYMNLLRNYAYSSKNKVVSFGDGDVDDEKKSSYVFPNKIANTGKQLFRKKLDSTKAKVTKIEAGNLSARSGSSKYHWF